MVDIMNKDIGLGGNRSPFAAVQTAIKEAFEADTKMSVQILVDDISQIFHGVAENFALMLQDEDVAADEDEQSSQLKKGFLEYAEMTAQIIDIAQEERNEARRICYNC